MLLPINQDEKAVLETALEVYIGELEVLNQAKISPFLRLRFQDNLADARRLLEELRKVGKPSVYEMDKQIRDFLKCNYKINAIKYVREVTGKGLKESKDYVDAIEAKVKAEAEDARKVSETLAKTWQEEDERGGGSCNY